MFKIMQQYGDTYEFESAAEIVEGIKEVYPEEWEKLTKGGTNYAESNLLFFLSMNVFTEKSTYHFQDLKICAEA